MLKARLQRFWNKTVLGIVAKEQVPVRIVNPNPMTHFRFERRTTLSILDKSDFEAAMARTFR